MKILLDENLDWRLGRLLVGHAVTSVPKSAWSGIRNGDLLRQAEGLFDALVTMDRSIYHQQNLGGLRLAIVTLRVPTNRFADTSPLMPLLLDLLARLKPGEFHRMDQAAGTAQGSDHSAVPA